ncbi:MAG: FecR domain-containing protein [Mediterranea sp.]|jgi:ferric-dicitrate binding protein FerR (iron transport regulator)|nr:FecR domain-containing protein [Mediterranea sp.]
MQRKTHWERLLPLIEESSGYTPDTRRCWQELCRRLHIEERTAPTRYTFYKYAAVACLLIAVALGTYIAIPKGQPVQLAYHCVSGRSNVSLPDHSSVWLHEATQLSYTQPDSHDHLRRVTLTGEAYFDVSHDEKHPFVIQTDGMSITVRGTKFNVEAFPDSEETNVSLLEGSVALQTATEHSVLTPGETAVYNKRDRRLSIEQTDVRFATSWATDRLQFSQQPLREVCRYLAKWYRMKIEIDPALSDTYRYSFTLRDEPLDEILRLMDRLHPMRYTFHEDKGVTIHARRDK